MPAPSVPLDAVPQPAMLFDAGGRIVAANHAADALAGRPLAGLANDDLVRIFQHRRPDGTPLAPGDLPSTRARTGEDGDTVEVPLVITAADGRALEIVGTATPIVAGDAVTGVLVVWRDLTAQKQAERALCESEERYRALIETNADFVWELDKEGRYTYCSPQMEALWGIPPKEALGRTPFERMPPPEQERMLGAFRDFGATPAAFRGLESTTVDGRGRRVEVETSAVPFFDGDGVLAGWRGVTRDITGLKRAEAALRESEEQYRALVEDARSIILRHDASGRITFFNEYAETFFGFTKDEVLGRPATETIVPPRDSSGRYLEAMVADLAVHPERYATNENVTKNGDRVWIHWSNRPVFDADGSVREFLSVGTDITDRRRAEEEVRRNRATLKAALESMTDAVVIADADGRLVEMNGACAPFYRFGSRDDYLWTIAEYPAILEGFSPDGTRLPPEEWIIPRALRGETGTNVEYPLRRRDTGETWIASYGFGPIRDDAGAIVGAVVVGRDVTEQKRAEAALRESEEEYRLIVEHAPTAIFEIDYAGPRFRRVNDAMCRVLGYSRDELLAMDPGALLDDESRERLSGRVRTALGGGPLGGMAAYRCRARDGREIWAELDVRPLYTDGAMDGALVVAHDVTQRQRAGERQAFLLRLGDAIRPLADPVAIQAEASRVLGEHLGGARAAYGEVAGDELVVVDRASAAPGAAPPTGSFRMTEFGAAPVAELRAGRTTVVPELARAPGFTDAERAALGARGVASFVGVPLVKGGRLLAGLVVFDGVPRGWTPDEVALIEETAERTWAAVERAQAEEALRLTQFHYQALLEYSMLSFVRCRTLFDADGVPDDYEVLEVNEAYLAMTGFSDLVGKRITEIVPGVDRDLIDFHNEVALSGISRQTEVYSAPLDRWYHVNVYSPTPGELVSLSLDITGRKRTEEALQESEAKYRELFATMDEGFALHELVLDDGGAPVDYRFLAVNPAFEAMTGLAAGEIVGRTAMEVLPGLEPGWVERYGRVATTGEPASFESYSAPLDRWYVVHASSPGPGRFATVFSDITERKRAEEALREAEERLRFALDAGRFGTFYYTPATGEVARDERVKAFWGLAPGEDLDLAGVAERIHPDDRERVMHIFRSAFDPDGDGTYEADYRVVLPDGALRWIRARGRVRFQEADGTRTAVIMVGIENNITGQKRVEAELTESAARLRASERDARARAEEIATIYDTAPVGLCVIDRDLRFVRLNHRFAEINGVPVEAHLGRTPHEVVPDLGEQAEAALQRVLETGETVEFEATGETPADPGVVRYWDERWVPIRDGAGAIAGVSISAMEVTERKRAEAALQESAAKYRDLFMNDITGDFVAGADGRILDCNPAFARLFGFASVEEALASSIVGTYTSPADRDALLERLRTEGRIVNDERFRRRLDGTPIHVVENILGIFDSDGNLVRTQGYIIDDTERHRAEEALRKYTEELRRSNEDLERFAYVSSHDLQEPLRSIVSFSQLLERRYKGQLGQDGDEYIDFIVEGGNRMQTLILDLLAYSRVNTNPQALRPTDVGAVMAAVERHLDPQLREAGAVLTHDPLPTVTADPLQLEQVFVNLVSNAIKFRRPDEPLRVHVSARREDGVWEFSVRDNGIGIEPEYFEKIFVIFQRLHTKDAYPGTGIGLAIVKRIIDRHGGRCRVESVPGEGSTFSFTLPAA